MNREIPVYVRIMIQLLRNVSGAMGGYRDVLGGCVSFSTKKDTIREKQLPSPKKNILKTISKYIIIKIVENNMIFSSDCLVVHKQYL